MTKEEMKAHADGQLRAWRLQEAEEIASTENRLAKEYGLENHPKRGKLWAMAWEHGHASGFSEVEMWYNELAELLK